jgi:hypothetical protein
VVREPGRAPGKRVVADLWPGCELPKLEDTVEVSEEFLAGASDAQLVDLAKHLGVITGDAALNGDSLRALLRRQELQD